MRKALYILGLLDDSDIEWMAQHGKRISLDSNECLIRQSSPIDSLYILLEGQLSVRIGETQDKEIAVLLPGEVVGEISFVDNRLPTASVVALRDSKLLALPRSDLFAILTRDTGFASRFYRAIASFLADRLYVTTSHLGYGNVNQDMDVDEISESMMDDISIAAIRFDKLVRFLADEGDIGSFAAVKL